MPAHDLHPAWRGIDALAGIATLGFLFAVPELQARVPAGA
jgi:hypothetical protein